MLKFFKDFVRDENGMEMVEWTIVAVVFAVAAITAWTELDEAIGEALQIVEDEITNLE